MLDECQRNGAVEDALGSGSVTLEESGTLVDGVSSSASGTIANAVTIGAGGGTINGQERLS